MNVEGGGGYRICTRCIMDTSDPDIRFDADGVCSHCQRVDRVLRPLWPHGEVARQLLEARFAQIRAEGRGREYDCVLGISGGVDSSFLASLLAVHGLRPLVIHVDAGWNSEIAVSNIEKVVRHLNFDLQTYVLDWEDVRDLQLAFLRASVANQDIPQDHAFTAQVYRSAMAHGIRYVISGSNFATESILPAAWGYNAMDLRHIRAIHRRFGSRRLRSYPTVGLFRYYVWYPFVRRMEVIRPLNWIDYSKQAAMAHLQREFGWTWYGGKHFESRFTKFFQAHYLPSKFGYDKRRAHLSSQVVGGELTREQALAEMQKPAYPPGELEADHTFVAKKLGLSAAELDALIALPNRSYADYPSNAWLFDAKDRLKARLRRGRASHAH